MKLRKGLFCHRPVIALFFFTFLVDGWAQTIETNSTDCGLFFAIPDASCTASSNYAIDVQNAPGSQLGADVLLEEIRLIIEHDWVGDLEISLTSPSGVRIPLSLKNGRGGQNYGDPTSPACTAPTIFSRRACTSIQNAVPPFIGTFLPEGNLNDFNDGSNPLGNWILQVCDVQADNTGWVQFVELVFSDNICQPPTDVSIRSISASGVELFWSSANTSCTDFIVEYGPPGFQPDSAGTSSDGFIQVVPCTAGLPFLLTGLEEFSTYDLYVRQLCGADVYSPNSCQLQFTTDCLPPPPSLEETFDAQNPCGRSCADDCNLSGSWYNVSTDDQDWLVNRGATTSSKTGPSDDISGGGQYIYTEASNRECPLASLTELRSNCLMIDTSQSNCHLSFFYHMYGSETGSLQLEASIDGGQNWVLLWILSGDQGDQWFRQFIDLGFFHDRVVQFRFVATRGTSFKSDIALDQISFYGAQDLGTSLFQYFLDLDGDGFGDPNEPISSCVPNIPPNYVSNALDCDDALFEINPSAAEILCNGLDENCNGMADDTFIPAPRVEEVRVCQGEQAVLNVSTPAAGAYYWYAAPTATQAIATGPQLNLGLVSTSGFYYLVDSLDAGCSSERQAIQLIVRPIPILSSNENPAVCFGERFDLATLDINDDNLTGGRLRYFARDPSSGADSLSSSSVQILSDTSFYIQSITDFGCSDVIVMDFKVHELPGIEISPAADQLICANGSTILTAIPGTSGTPPYELSWSNGSNRSRIRANAALPGSQTTHSVRITDANGCQQADSIQVETLASITAIAINEVKDVSDCNGADGLIRLEPANGLAPYDYQWNGPVVGSLSGQTSETTLNNLRQGSYRITISDQSGANCSLILPVVLINGPSVVVDTNIVIEPTSCPNSSDGSIDINILSGNPNFLWSNGATTEDISQLPSAKYSVTISEGTCVNVLNDLFVGSPDTLDIILMDQQSVSCKDGTDGLLAVAVSGGTPPYQYTWSNGRTEALVDGLSAGLYDLTVTDDNSCSAVLSAVEVTEPASLGISVNQIRMPACFGALNGAVDVSVDGGTEPYVYSWSDASNMEDATGLGLGTYQLTVTDANNCQLVSEAIVLMEPGELSIDAFIQAASCNGVNDGRIDLTVSGGTMPYTYQWSNGAMSKDLAELESGVYHLTLTDANGCRKEFDDFEIEAPGLIGFDRIAIQEPACPGIDDGFILFSIKGGTAPYEYNWSDGERQKDRMGLGKGDYVLTVTDANGCVFVSDTIDLDFLVPLEYVLSFSSDISCSGRSDGSVLITPLWNAQGFSYQWNNGDTQAFIDGLSKGAYVCTITGAAGCILVTDTIEIQEPDPLDVVVANLEDASCHSLADGNIDVIVSGGRTPYEYSWNTGATTEDLGQVRAGNYSLTIRDSSNCGYTSDIIRVDEPDPLAVDIVNIINVGCAGSANGSIEIQVRGGNEPYDIQWETGDTSLLLSKLSPDKYDLTITDANSCQL
ncbi:MAG: proprotein convertase P-domain-containing protein, partial [Bacteroidota bacterium]